MDDEIFEWDLNKNLSNFTKHGVSFFEAQYVFLDPNRIVAEDIDHSGKTEKRYYCFGRVNRGILTVRFTYRNQKIRIFGAGFWRKGKKIYEKAQD